MKTLDVNVWGAGYVGVVNAIGLASVGHNINLVETSEAKLSQLKSGTIPHYEPELQKLLTENMERLSFSSEVRESASNLHVVCVGSPANEMGEVVLDQVLSCIHSILKCTKTSEVHIIVRSTLPPGTMRNVLLPLVASESDPVTQKVILYHYPEFLREGCAVEDYFNSNLNVVACSDHEDASLLQALYRIGDDLDVVDFEVSEMIKYMNNSFHALKVVFANEMGSLAKECSVPREELFRLFLKDKKLNISEKYLLPGLPYGGACLTKETSALERMISSKGLKLPLINQISKSNDAHQERMNDLFLDQKFKAALIFGACFKNKTDDDRESSVMKMLQGWLDNVDKKSTSRVTIYERAEVIAKLQDSVPFSFIENSEKPLLNLGEFDLLFLGPMPVSDSLVEQMSSFNGTIIDGWGRGLSSKVSPQCKYIKF